MLCCRKLKKYDSSVKSEDTKGVYGLISSLYEDKTVEDRIKSVVISSDEIADDDSLELDIYMKEKTGEYDIDMTK